MGTIEEIFALPAGTLKIDRAEQIDSESRSAKKLNTIQMRIYDKI